MQYKGSCYRVFKNGMDAYKEHSNFLTGRSRYDFLFQLKRTDYKGWARGFERLGKSRCRSGVFGHHDAGDGWLRGVSKDQEV